MGKMRYILLIGFLIFVSFGHAQQLPQYSQYLLNDFVINPAIGGKNQYAEIKSNNRYQWVGITDAPRTYILSANGPTKNLKMGLGGYIFTDIVGPTRRTGGYLSYSYHLKLTEKLKLSFGVSAGLLQFAVDGSKISLHDQGDQIISNSFQSVLLPDAGAGLYLHGERFYFGISNPQMLQNKLRFFKDQTSSQSRLAGHYYATMGYKIPLGESFKIEPSAMVKYVKPSPLQIDASLRAIYKDKFWLGGTYRMKDASSVMVGYIFNNQFTFGYSYDIISSNLKNYSSGTHEIVIGVRFMPKKHESAPQVN